MCRAKEGGLTCIYIKKNNRSLNEIILDELSVRSLINCCSFWSSLAYLLMAQLFLCIASLSYATLNTWSLVNKIHPGSSSRQQVKCICYSHKFYQVKNKNKKQTTFIGSAFGRRFYWRYPSSTYIACIFRLIRAVVCINIALGNVCVVVGVFVSCWWCWYSLWGVWCSL